MGRRGDMPGITARLGRSREPLVAIALTGTIIAGLALIGDIRTTWSFSALTVLIYYAITNVAALRLTGTNRLYPRAMSWLGLAGCLTLAAWIDPHVLGVGAAMIAAGVIWRMTLISTRR
jgi:APA family basic amino acid/polyamine antiporter